MLFRPQIVGLAAVNFTIQAGIYGVSFWLPQLVKNTGVTSLLAIGMLSAIPWTAATIGMLIITNRSDRQNKRIPYLVGCMLLGAAGLGCVPTIATQTAPAMLALSIATLGILTALPLFWTIPTPLLCTATAATGIGLINSIGSLGGFVAPYAFGALRDSTGSTAAGIYFLVGVLTIGAIGAQVLGRMRRMRSGVELSQTAPAGASSI